MDQKKTSAVAGNGLRAVLKKGKALLEIKTKNGERERFSSKTEGRDRVSQQRQGGLLRQVQSSSRKTKRLRG